MSGMMPCGTASGCMPCSDAQSGVDIGVPWVVCAHLICAGLDGKQRLIVAQALSASPWHRPWMESCG